MEFLLGQLHAPSPGSLGEWLFCLAAVLAIFFYGQQVWKGFQKAPNAVPQPLQTQRVQRMATFDELVQLRREFEVFREEQRASNQHLLEAGQARADMLREEISDMRENVHSRVNDVLKAVSRMEGKLDHRS